MTSNDRLQRAIEDVVETGFVGVTLHVREGQHTWSGSAGLAELGGTDRPPLDGHVRIGSNTKTFTAALVLQLVAEGGLGLDDPAADHLPALGLDGRITVRMLLQHTSGLFNFTGEVLPDGTLVPGTPAPYGPRARAWVDDRFGRHQPEDLVRQALANPARFEPGTDWSYSNTNYVLLRLLIEHVTGNPLTEELRRRILGPLGLTGTSIPDGSPDLPEPHPHAYYRLDDQAIDITRHDPSWISTGGDMISTTRDLAVFVSALLDGRLLPYELVAEMCAPEAKAGYGLGVFVQPAGGGTLITHNGGMAGFATFMYATPDGGRAMSAALTCVDDPDLTIAGAVIEARQRLVDEVFREDAAS